MRETILSKKAVVKFASMLSPKEQALVTLNIAVLPPNAVVGGIRVIRVIGGDTAVGIKYAIKGNSQRC